MNNNEIIEHLKNAKDEIETAKMGMDDELGSKTSWYHAETIENIDNMIGIIKGEDDAKVY